jgi:hypothetical protein
VEKELDYLIENFERYKSEVEGELKTIPNNQFLQGKVKGLEYALTMTKIYNTPDYYEYPIDIENDVRIAQISQLDSVQYSSDKAFDEIRNKTRENIHRISEAFRRATERP